MPANPEADGKGPEGKDRNSSKKLKVCSGGKAGDNGKVTSGSGNDGATQRSDYESYFCKNSSLWIIHASDCFIFFVNSDESRSEGTSDTNDENDNNVSVQSAPDHFFLCLHAMEIMSFSFILTLSRNG